MAILTPPPTLLQLFWGFSRIGLSGFGGVLPWARRYLVERYRWIDAPTFDVLLGMGQIMPGPNVINLAVCLGSRFHGWRGAVVAPLGLLIAPMVAVLLLAQLYVSYHHLPWVQRLLHGVSAVGAGLILATGIKMLLGYRHQKRSLALAALAIVGIAVFRWPLLWVLAVLAPVGYFCSRPHNDRDPKP